MKAKHCQQNSIIIFKKLEAHLDMQYLTLYQLYKHPWPSISQWLCEKSDHFGHNQAEHITLNLNLFPFMLSLISHVYIWFLVIFKAQVKLCFTSAFNKWKFLASLFLCFFLCFYLGHSKSGSK